MTDDDFRCPVCGEWRVTPGLLYDHVRQEHGLRCSCTLSFTSAVALLSHVKKEHPDVCPR